MYPHPFRLKDSLVYRLALTYLCLAMSLSGKITQIIDYLEEVIDTDIDDQSRTLIDAQYNHLTTIVQRYVGELALDDVTASLKLLKSDACQFSAAQTTALRQTIAAAGAPTASLGVQEVVRTYSKTQEHVAIHTYLTEHNWTEVFKDDATVDSIIDVIVEVLRNIGCTHPSPQPSMKHMTAFIHALLNTPATADDYYKTLNKLRDALHLARKHKVAGVPSGILKYTQTGTTTAADSRRHKSCGFFFDHPADQRNGFRTYKFVDSYIDLYI